MAYKCQLTEWLEAYISIEKGKTEKSNIVQSCGVDRIIQLTLSPSDTLHMKERQIGLGKRHTVLRHFMHCM